MIIISDNYYFTRGVHELLKKEKDKLTHDTNSSSKERIVIYDRGDGVVSLIPLGFFLDFRLKSDSFLYFMSTQFLTYDYKKSSISEFARLIFSSRGDRHKKMMGGMFSNITNLEKRILEVYLKGYDLERLVQITGRSKKSLYAVKYRLLEKIDINSMPLLIKVYRQWNKNVIFNEI